MRQIYTIEISVLVSELRDFIGYYIDKFYELDKGKFRFRISKRNSKIDLVCVLGQRFSATRYIETVYSPTNFTIAVRKRITGFKIDSINQLNGDRIISLNLSKGEETIVIIIEMFGKGNLILTDNSFKIDLTYLRHKFRDRSIIHGETYRYPRNSEITISNLQDIKSVMIPFLDESDEDNSIIKTLSRMVNVGSMYLEDILNGFDINPKIKIKDMDAQMIKNISMSIPKFSDMIAAPSFRVYVRDGKVVDYAIQDIRKYADAEHQNFDSLQEMLEYFYLNVEPTDPTKDNPKSIELEISIQKQKTILKDMLDNIGSNRKLGESIFNRMYIVNRIINTAYNDRHITKEKLEGMFPEIKIYDVNLQKKTIEIEL